MYFLWFAAKRVLPLILLSLAAAFATFLFSSLIPGDFFSGHLLDPSIQRETVESLRHKYGLEQPFHIQYIRWLRNLLRLDLGYSLFYQKPVLPVLAGAIANTLWMGIPALVLGFGGGIVLGTMHALYARQWQGKLLDVVSAVALSLPSLLLGLAALLFAAHTQWFPLGSMNSLEAQDSGMWHWSADRLYHLLLPVTCLTIPVLAYVERVQRAAVQGERFEPHVRCAAARGLRPKRIFLHYILRPALNPVLSISGPMLGGVLSGSLVLEIIFAWPGLGQITYDALFSSDLFLLAGCVVGSALLLVAGNLAADLGLMALDPRTRTALGKGDR